jgi:hypothetical protein
MKKAGWRLDGYSQETLECLVIRCRNLNSQASHDGVLLNNRHVSEFSIACVKQVDLQLPKALTNPTPVPVLEKILMMSRQERRHPSCRSSEDTFNLC